MSIRIHHLVLLVVVSHLVLPDVPSPGFAADGKPLSAAKKENAARGKKAFALKLRHRTAIKKSSETYKIAHKAVTWIPSQTAVVICDMWNEHWCKGATRRVAEMAPRMNAFVEAARSKGALIVHAPSGVTSHYKNHPAYQAALKIPIARNMPKDIRKWCYSIPAEEKAVYPIDQSDGGCDCQPKCKSRTAWSKQVAAIKIHDKDLISDQGHIIWSAYEQRGIRNVIILGVHTNMCVLGRPFGLRQMARNKKNVVLVRDLTDTMYNSRAKPYVNHFRGTDLIVAHIEKYVCPTITSNQILGGRPFKFKADPRPRKPKTE